MIYSVFIKKNQYDRARFAHVNLLRKIIARTGNVFVLGWPGFIGITKRTIDDFYAEINPSPRKRLNGFFFQPLIIKTIPGHGTNEQYMNTVFGNHTIPQPRLRDHSKIIVVLSVDLNNYSSYEDAIANDAYSVKAILLGSSNQSYNTYCLSPTPKGEADIFLIETNAAHNNVVDNDDSSPLIESIGQDVFNELVHNDDVVVSKEILATNKSLKAIVRKLLG